MRKITVGDSFFSLLSLLDILMVSVFVPSELHMSETNGSSRQLYESFARNWPFLQCTFFVYMNEATVHLFFYFVNDRRYFYRMLLMLKCGSIAEKRSFAPKCDSSCNDCVPNCEVG